MDYRTHHGPKYENNRATQLFDQFCSANTFQAIVTTFQQICDVLDLKPSDYRQFYVRLKTKLNSWKAQSLWVKLDKLYSHKDYRKGQACPNTRAIVIGAGPCGLRTAIELAMLGAKVVIVEKRDKFSRNNVLHLWPFLIHDLKSLGAKKFFGKFCAGAIDHISIRTLQCILLKVTLLFGIELHGNTSFEGVIEPPDNQEKKTGWKAAILPQDSPVSEYEFDVLIGADGKRNTLEGFKRKEFRGKLAIAITANFINRHTQAEARVEEISGVAFIFNQKFFQDLNAKTGIDLENIVYYKDETHYFVMTAKKQSLLKKGVLIKDHNETIALLARDNINQDKLKNYAIEAATVSTEDQLPNLEFAHNHYSQADVAMFDFTSIFAAENACRAIEKNGHKLLIAIVGDSLLEPFWPTGSGCARGFLGSLDAAWMVKQWTSGKMTPLEVIAERESIYQLLSQTTPENINKNFSHYSIDPNTRYPNLNSKLLTTSQVRHLYDCGNMDYQDEIVEVPAKLPKYYDFIIDSARLLQWCQKHLEYYTDIVVVNNLTTCWKSGLALCALIHHYRPQLIDLYSLNENEVAQNNQLAFDIAQKELGIPPVMSGQEMADSDTPDKLTMVSYLSQFHDLFRKEKPPKSPKSPLPSPDGPQRKIATSGKMSFLQRLTNKLSRKKDKREKENEPESINASHESLKRKEQALFGGMAKKRITDMEKGNDVTLKGYNKIGDHQSKVKDISWGVKGKVEMDMDVGVRGQNRVSALAGKLVSQWGEHETTPVLQRKMNVKPVFGQMSSEYCFFCQKRVYLMERLTAEGVFFHRGCLKCEYCGSGLRIGNYAFEKVDGEPKFYCIPHLSMKKRLRRKRSISDIDGKVQKGTEQRKPTSPKRQSSLDVPQPRYSTRTPERIEFENSMDEMDMEQSEDAQTEHNLRSSLSTSPYEDNGNDSESDSESSGEEDDNEGNNSDTDKIGDFQQSLDSSYKLAKDWVRKSTENLLEEDFSSKSEEDSEDDDAFEEEEEKPASKPAANNRKSFFMEQAVPVRIDPSTFFKDQKKSPTEKSAEAGVYIDTDQAIADQPDLEKLESKAHISEEADNEASSEEEAEDLNGSNSTPSKKHGTDSVKSYYETEDGVIYEKGIEPEIGSQDNDVFLSNSLDEKYVTDRRNRKKKSRNSDSFTISTPSGSRHSDVSDLSIELSANKEILEIDLDDSLELQREYLKKLQSSLSEEDQMTDNTLIASEQPDRETFQTPPNNLLVSDKYVTPNTSFQANDRTSPVRRPNKLTLGSSSSIEQSRSSSTPKSPQSAIGRTRIVVDKSMLDSYDSRHEKKKTSITTYDAEIGRKKIKPLSSPELHYMDSSSPEPARTKQNLFFTHTVEANGSNEPCGSDSSGVRKRLLPTLPIQDKQLSTEEIKKRREQERDRLRARARERARKKSDEELGVGTAYTPGGGIRRRLPGDITDSASSPSSPYMEEITETESDTTCDIVSKEQIVTDSLPSKTNNLTEDNIGSKKSVDTENNTTCEDSGIKTLKSSLLDPADIAVSFIPESPNKTSESSTPIKNKQYYSQTSEEIMETIRENMDLNESTSSSGKKKKDKKSKDKDKTKEKKTKKSKDSNESKSPRGSCDEAKKQLSPQGEKKRHSFLQLFMKKDKRKSTAFDSSENELTPRTPDSDTQDKKKKSLDKDKKDIVGEGNYEETPKSSKSKTKSKTPKSKDKKKKKKHQKEASVEDTVDGELSLADKVKEMKLKESVFLNGENKRPQKDQRLRAPVATMDDEFSESDSEQSSIGRNKSMTGDTAEDVLMEKIQKRVQKAARRQQRQRELKRLHMAQEIQRQLNEVEVKQREMEERGVVVEKALRGEGPEGHRTESEMMQEWFNLVHEKHVLVRYESELMVRAKELELEDRHGRLEQALRERMSKDESKKTTQEVEDEKKILDELLEVVAQRDALVVLLEEDRLREKEEDKDLQSMMMTKGFELSPVSYSIKTGKSTRGKVLDV